MNRRFYLRSYVRCTLSRNILIWLARWTNISDVGLIRLAKLISPKKFTKAKKHTLPNVNESARLLVFQIQLSRMITSSFLRQFNRKWVRVTGIDIFIFSNNRSLRTDIKWNVRISRRSIYRSAKELKGKNNRESITQGYKIRGNFVVLWFWRKDWWVRYVNQDKVKVLA